MKVDKLVDILKEYDGFDIDFMTPNGERFDIYEFWSIKKVSSVSVVLKNKE